MAFRQFGLPTCLHFPPSSLIYSKPLDVKSGPNNWLIRLTRFRKVFAPNSACKACGPWPSSAGLTEAAASSLQRHARSVHNCSEILFCSLVTREWVQTSVKYVSVDCSDQHREAPLPTQER